MTELAFSDLTVCRGDRALLSEVSLTVATGELVALVGPNGAGKTTLLRAALGLCRPTRGRVTLDGIEATALDPRERASRVAWLPQTSAVSEPMSVIEHVRAGRYRFRESAAHARSGAERALGRVGVAALAERALGSLSGGERQRVALATVLAQETPLLLLDEPANHLDPRQERETFRLVGELARAGHGILCVTHDVALLAVLPDDCPTRVVGLGSGRLAFDVALREPALPDRLSALFGLRWAYAERDGQRALVPWWPASTTTEPPCA